MKKNTSIEGSSAESSAIFEQEIPEKKPMFRDELHALKTVSYTSKKKIHKWKNVAAFLLVLFHSCCFHRQPNHCSPLSHCYGEAAFAKILWKQPTTHVYCYILPMMVHVIMHYDWRSKGMKWQIFYFKNAWHGQIV
jgi:hypothetical protein